MRIQAKVNFLVGIPLVAFMAVCSYLVFNKWEDYQASTQSFLDLEAVVLLSQLVDSLQKERSIEGLLSNSSATQSDVEKAMQATDSFIAQLQQDLGREEVQTPGTPRTLQLLQDLGNQLPQARKDATSGDPTLHNTLIKKVLRHANDLGNETAFEDVLPQFATLAILEKAKESSRRLHDLMTHVAAEDEALSYEQINLLLDYRGGIDANLHSPGLVIDSEMEERIDAFAKTEHWEKSSQTFGTLFALAADGEYELNPLHIERHSQKIAVDIDQLWKDISQETSAWIGKAKEQARQVLIFASVGLGVLALAIIVVGKRIIRGITNPLNSAVSALKALAKGDLTTRLSSDSNDEVGDMAKALTHAITSMRDTLQVEEVNWDELAEQKQREIEATNNMKTLLAGLTEGVFFFDPKGNISEQRSGALAEILPGSAELKNTFELFERFGSRNRENIQNCLDIFWPEDTESLFLIDFEVSAAMLPQRVHLDSPEGDRVVDFHYKEFFGSDGSLDKIMVFVSDVTKALKDEQEARVQRERVARISTGVKDVKSYQLFFEETCKVFRQTNDIFEGRYTEDDALTLLKRTLHTIKGNVRSFDFQSVSDMIHDLESLLEEYGMGGLDRMRPDWEAAKDRWKFETNDLNTILGISKNDSVVSFRREKIEALQTYAQTHELKKLSQLLDQLGHQPIESVITKHLRMAQSIVDRSEGKSIQFRFAEDNQEVAHEEISRIDGALGHIFRNMVDHGVEPVSERLQSGKSEAGTIQVECYRVKSGGLHLVISDDGKGIDAERLAAKAVESSVWSRKQAAKARLEEKIQLIFENGLSSKESVNATSGRGVGMDAVKHEIESLGGSISVFSERGQGTQFEIDLPPLEAESLPQSKAS